MCPGLPDDAAATGALQRPKGGKYAKRQTARWRPRLLRSDGASLSFDTLRDLLGDELSILRHPAQQRRAARVLPCEAKKVEVRNVGSPALVANDPVGVEDGKIDPRIIGLVTRRPDHSVDL